MKEKKVNFIGNYDIFESNSLYEVKTIDDCIDWIKDLPFICLDTETEGFFDHKNRIIMLQLSDGINVWVLDTRNTDYIQKLKPYLENKLILGQNLKFDYKFLKYEGVILNHIYDTFLAECILTNGLDNRQLGLGAITKKYCNFELDKSVRNQFIGLKGQPFTHKQIVYGAEDVLYLPEIKEKQLEQINQLDLLNWLNLENKSCLVLADIEYNGMCFSPEKWLKLADIAESHVKDYSKELDKYVLEDSRLSAYVSQYVQGDLFGGVERAVNIKWSSPTQVVKVFRTLGMDIEDVLEKTITKYQAEYPIVKQFIDYKKEAKLATTYGKDFLKFINKQTKRIHTDYWQILNTARISSSNPNLQQIPAKKEYFASFEAPKGYKIVGADFSGQELRLIAEGSKDPIWLAAFNEGKDLHGEVAAIVFGINIDEVKEKPEFVFAGSTKVYLRGKSPRDVAKTINFMLAYGGSEFKLSDTLGISIDEAKAIIDNYFKAVPKVKKFLEALAKYGLNNGFIRSYRPYSGIRFFDNYDPKNCRDQKLIGAISRASKNTPIQMSGAMMCKLAMVNLREEISKLNYKVEIFSQIHDAIFTYCEEEYAEEWGIKLKQIMEESGKVFINSIPVISDLVISDYWKK